MKKKKKEPLYDKELFFFAAFGGDKQFLVYIKYGLMLPDAMEYLSHVTPPSPQKRTEPYPIFSDY